MYDQFDVTLEDGDLLREVELTTNLIIAASEADERLSLEEIDALVRAHGPEQRDEEYQALARKDGIHPDVADAFEEEIRIRGREIRRKDEERRRRDLEGQSDGFPVDPF